MSEGVRERNSERGGESVRERERESIFVVYGGVNSGNFRALKTTAVIHVSE